MQSPSELRARLLQPTLDLLWCQWTAMGVAGTRTCDGFIIDPEALLLATLGIGRSDARLFDEALDWVSVNAKHLDMSRMRRLGKSGTTEQQSLLGVVADIAIEHGAKSSFGQLVEAGILAREASAGYGLTPLFVSGHPTEPDWAGTDDRFAQAGFARSPLNLRAMSASPRASLPACMRFRARALFGVGARAEVATYLWCHEWAHGRLIAERSAYNQAPVAEYLTVLAEANLADRRVAGRRTLYRLRDDVRIAGGQVPTYVDWVRVWPALVAILEVLDSDGGSENAVWLGLARVLGEQRESLAAEGLGVHVPDLGGWARSGAQVLVFTLDEVVARVEALVV